MCANICTFILYVIKHIFKKISYIRLKRAARITADDSQKLTNFINSYSSGAEISSPLARRASRSESVLFSSTIVMSTLVDCICGV